MAVWHAHRQCFPYLQSSINKLDFVGHTSNICQQANKWVEWTCCLKVWTFRNTFYVPRRFVCFDTLKHLIGFQWHCNRIVYLSPIVYIVMLAMWQIVSLQICFVWITSSSFYTFSKVYFIFTFYFYFNLFSHYYYYYCYCYHYYWHVFAPII